jgi:predicted enzyme related to lactoylglutathione lyase
MQKNIRVIVYPVKDTEKAKAFFDEFLGVKPYVDSEYYIGYKVGDLEIGLDPNSDIGPISYIDVDDIEESLEKLTEVGGEIVQDVTDVANGLLVAKVRDTDGNVVGYRQNP